MAYTLNDVFTLTRSLLQSDTNELPDATLIPFANEAMLDLRRKLIKKRADLFNQESQRDFTANEIVGGSSPGKFLLPSDMYFLKSVEVNYQDPTQQQLFIPLSKVDSSNLPQGVTQDWLRTNQPTNQPMYDVHGDWFEIFPTPTTELTNALKINYYLQPTSFTATTDAINYPESLDYTILANKIASIYLQAQGRDYTAQETSYVQKVNDMILLLDGEAQQPTQATNVPWTGWEF